MSFHFNQTESSARALRRVCREHVGTALRWLLKSRRPVAIHNVRKEIKKARAMLRLVRDDIGPDAYRKTARPLRKAAKRLAASRDARVMLEAFKTLAGDGIKQFPKIHAALRKQCQRETRRFRKADSLAVVEQNLWKTSHRVRRLKIMALGWAAMAPGLKRSYSFGQEKFRFVRREPSVENFHAWRKQVKSLLYHLRMLCPAWPPKTAITMKKLDALGEQLGDEHDLALLEQFLREHRVAQTREMQRFHPLLAAQQKRLRSTALKLGSQLYAEPSLVVCRRLEHDWKLWRGEDNPVPARTEKRTQKKTGRAPGNETNWRVGGSR